MTPAAGDPVRVLVRGGGDLATGVAWRLHRAGFAVLVCELAEPLTVRRTVSFSSAVRGGSVTVEGVTARRCDGAGAPSFDAVLAAGEVPVIVSPGLPTWPSGTPADVVIDARMAKRNLGTTIADAALVIGLGPGFTPGVDCHAVVETQRGHDLGRVLWDRPAAPNTGLPGEVGGRGAERVVRAPSGGPVLWAVSIGDVVAESQTLGSIGRAKVRAPFRGVVRGLVADGLLVAAGMKIGDIDPRLDTPTGTISDKALAIGGGALEAVMSWRSGRAPLAR